MASSSPSNSNRRARLSARPFRPSTQTVRPLPPDRTPRATVAAPASASLHRAVGRAPPALVQRPGEVRAPVNGARWYLAPKASPSPMSAHLRHSVWLLPAEAEAAPLEARIRSLARSLGGPPFRPHLTLVGGLKAPAEAVARCVQELAGVLAPLRLQVEELAATPDYFRALLLDVRRLPELVEAHRLSSELLGRAPDPAFRPHLSLFYGELPEPTKLAAARALGPPIPRELVADRIGVYPTGLSVPAWSPVLELPLRGG